jgi:hypothetical protein
MERTIKTKLATILTIIAAETEPLLRKQFEVPDCCIGATRAILRVLEHHKIEARCLPVQVEIWNPAATSAIKSGAAEPPPDGWRIKLGTGRSARGSWAEYAAHVVVALPKHRRIIPDYQPGEPPSAQHHVAARAYRPGRRSQILSRQGPNRVRG